MATVTTVANATLTTDQVEALLVQPLRQQSSYLSIGFPEFTSPGNVIRIPSLTSLGTATVVAEGSAVAEATLTTSEIELLPSDVYAVGRMVKVSNQTISTGVFDVESAFASSLVTEIQRAVDEKLWAGAGTAGDPLGLLNFANNIAYSTAVGTATPGTLYEMVETAQAAFLNDVDLHWAVSPKGLRRIRTMEDGSGRNMLQPSMSAGVPATILGYGYTVTTFVPDGTIALIDKSKVAVGRDTTASVFITPHRYAEERATAIIASLRVDTAPMTAAVVKATGITA